MTEDKKKVVSWLAGLFAVFLFASLLGIRLGIPEKFRERDAQSPSSGNASPYGENWLEIRQKGVKIGYVHRKKEKEADGRTFSEEIVMRINTMGVVQPVTVRTSTRLKPGGEVKGFRLFLTSNLFTFKAEGEVVNGQMHIRTGDQNEEKRFALPGEMFMAGDLLESSIIAEMKNGEERVFPLFDPVSLTSKRAVLKLLGEETLPVDKKTGRARKISFDFNGMKQLIWVSADGSVIREEGMMGLVMQSVSPKEALAGIDEAGGPDMIAASAVPVSKPLEDSASIKRLMVRLDGFDTGNFQLDGGRQVLTGKTVTITSEKSLKPLPGNGENMRSFLEPAPFIESDHPEIIKKARDIVKDSGNEEQKARKLVDWVYHHIAKKPVLSIPDALQTLKLGEGDCNEHAVLLAALGRAVGLPVRVEAGLVYLQGSFFFHAWNAFYISKLGGWITADAALGQFPADVTHLRFTVGSLEKQADIVGLIGRVKIEIVKVER